MIFDKIWLEITNLHIFFVYLLIKWLFLNDLGFFLLSLSYYGVELELNILYSQYYQIYRFYVDLLCYYFIIYVF